jgi:hypothetical protein
MRAYLLVALVAACGNMDSGDDAPVDCTMVTGTDTFTVGLEKMGAVGTLDFKLMSIDPAPQPVRGDNTWIVQLNSMNNSVVGAPIDGAALEVTPYMPAHGHGTPIIPTITPTGDAGQYKVAPVNLWMPGVWQTTIKATPAGGTADKAVYTFCLPG